MEILIKIKNRDLKIILLDDKNQVDFLGVVDEYRLSEKLLPEIDKIIKRNKLKKVDIKKIIVESDQEDNFTTTRIAKSVANSWNYGIGQ